MTTPAKPFARAARPALILTLVALAGCTRWMRDPDFYASELTTKLEERSPAIAACYERVLEHDAAAKGELVVEFDIAKKTGEIAEVEVVASETSVPEPLAACVTAELATLRMDPPDAKSAHASFAWSFAPGSRKRPPADPFVEAQTALLGCYSTHLATVDREAKGELIVDYAFDRTTGALERLAIAETSSAPAPVIACAKPAFEAARIEPEKLDDRNAAGQRTFALRFTPYPK
ncbi:hypothetical protein ACNOYE_39325 [Nannocystaceae bacterium ST9]